MRYISYFHEPYIPMERETYNKEATKEDNVKLYQGYEDTNQNGEMACHPGSSLIWGISVNTGASSDWLWRTSYIHLFATPVMQQISVSLPPEPVVKPLGAHHQMRRSF